MSRPNWTLALVLAVLALACGGALSALWVRV